MPEVQSTGETKLRRSWDPWKMFDLSSKEIALAKSRQELAAAKKTKFRMIANNPQTLVNGGIGGHLTDPSIKRWEAARATSGDHFRISPKNTSYLVILYILPIIGLYAVSSYKRKKYDDECKRGEISTKDRSIRNFLFLN